MSIISGLASVASTLLGARSAKQNTDLTNKANKELAAYGYSKDLEAWNRQNEYNLPSSQMARLKAAGLNPNLVYGNGAAQSQAATMPKYNAPTMNYNYKPAVDPLTMLGAFQDFQIRGAQLDNLRAQNEAIKTETTNKQLQGILLDQRGEKYRNEWRWDLENKMRDVWTKEQGYEQKKSIFPFQLQAIEKNNALKQKELDMFDWTKWSQLLQGFGLKLPSFRK